MERLVRATGQLPAGRIGKWAVAALWLVALLFLAPYAAKLGQANERDPAQWLPRNAESTEALRTLTAQFKNADLPLAVIVYERQSGLTAADQARIEADRAALARYAADGTVPPALPSEDRQAALLTFPVAVTGNDESTVVGAIADRLAETDTPGLRVAMTGSAGVSHDISDAFSGVDRSLLGAAAIVVTVLLLLIYRSPALWLLPVLCAGVASLLGYAAAYLASVAWGLTVNPQNQGIMAVLAFGVATDYALLLIARHREELRRRRDVHEAMRIALRRSAPAVLASAATVIVALLFLSFAQLTNVRSLGAIAAIGVASALVAMTTLLPALLAIFGRWIFWPFVPRYDPSAAERETANDHPWWDRMVRRVTTRNRLTWIVTGLVLVGLTAGLWSTTLGLPASEAYSREVGSVVGQRLISRHYTPGVSGPVEIVCAASAADAVVAAAKGTPGVADARRVDVSRDGTRARVNAFLADDPDSAAARATVGRLRAAVHAIPGAGALVGGQTANAVDTDEAARRDNAVVMPLILAVVFVVLMILLRALVAPLVLFGSVVLTFLAALGLSGWLLAALGYAKLDSALPLLAFLFLVSLGVDYTIFLMHRAREETGRLGHAEGVKHALIVTGGVITSAGLVLAGTFLVLTTLPMVLMIQLGIVVGIGIILDSIVTRSLLVPSFSLDVGPAVWWPGRLWRAGR